MRLLFLLPAICLGFFGLSTAWGHVDSPLLTDECGSCHVGHGMAGEPMLEAGEEEMCYLCHGDSDKQSEMKSKGRLSPSANPKDIEREFNKPFRHPVLEGSGHSPDERLPAYRGAEVSHAECVDCHNPHQRVGVGKKTYYEVAGYSLSGQYIEKSLREYEICLKCHAEQTGSNNKNRSIIDEFALSSRSQHPVTISASGEKLPSLSVSLAQGQMLLCSDCHTSDDPDGPKGPHGSNHRFLLSGNYNIDMYADESPYAYEFCYSCHDRESILSDESFSWHSEHIEGDPITGRSGTSCYTCHASHGSSHYDHLLDFNQADISGDSKTMQIRYQKTGENSGECFLNCHGYDHGPAQY